MRKVKFDHVGDSRTRPARLITLPRGSGQRAGLGGAGAFLDGAVKAVELQDLTARLEEIETALTLQKGGNNK